MVRPMVVLILVVAGVHPLGAQLTQELAVSRLRGVSIDDARVDEILKEVGDLLRTRDSPEDHQAPVFFRSLGQVQDLNSPGAVFGPQDFKRVIGQPGYIRVVSEIIWCVELRPLTGFDGCGFSGGLFDSRPFLPGTIVKAVVRSDPSATAVAWAHEYIHSKGGADRQDPSAVMSGPPLSKNRVINLAECKAVVAPHSNHPYARSSGVPGDRACMPVL